MIGAAALVGPIVFQTTFLGFRFELEHQRVVVLGLHSFLHLLSFFRRHGNRLNHFLFYFGSSIPVARGETLRTDLYSAKVIALFQFRTKTFAFCGRSVGCHRCGALLFGTCAAGSIVSFAGIAGQSSTAPTARVGVCRGSFGNRELWNSFRFLFEDDRKILVTGAKGTGRPAFLLRPYLQKAFGAHVGVAARSGVDFFVH